MRKRLWINIARRVSLIGALAILVGWFLRQYRDRKPIAEEYTIPTHDDVEAVLPKQVPATQAEAGETKTVITAKAPAAEPVAVPDDLRKIEGIGPKIAGVLTAAGISTFAQLAVTEVKELRQILQDAGVRVAYPDTWPEQAALAAAGSWEELEHLQSQLDRGRRTG